MADETLQTTNRKTACRPSSASDTCCTLRAVLRLRETGRQSTPRAPSEAAAMAQATRPLEQDGSRVICAACGAFVAAAADRMEVNGAHEHAFINPAGLIFRVGCFAEAPGVHAVGEESAHWTWFVGFAWRAARCRSCHEHLGWCYRSALATFVALILDKVAERGAPGDAR